MSITRYPDFFNDVLGPVMQPGSSSHTAAPCRLGLLARNLLYAKPAEIQFIMDPDGSFAGMFGLMNEGNGMLAGVMNIKPDDARLFRAPEIARQRDIRYRFLFEPVVESRHANAVKIRLTARDGHMAELTGESTGGGMVHVSNIDGFRVDLYGDCYALLVFSSLTCAEKHELKSTVSGLLAEEETQKTGGERLYLLLCSERPVRAADILQGRHFSILAPVLPVVAKVSRQPQLFASISQWNQIARQRGIGMSETAILYEMNFSQLSRRQIIVRMKRIMRLLIAQVEAAYQPDAEAGTPPFSRNDCAEWTEYQQREAALSGDPIAEIIRRVQGVSAKIPGTPIVPGPMGTGGGYLFSALYSVAKQRGFREKDVLRGLFIAAGVGALAYTHTQPTGEVVGCAGECGVCCAMGAAAIVEMAGGSGEQIGHAASLALQAFIGLPCDPVPGGREAPCFSRVLAAAVMAVVYADIALSGATTDLTYEDMLHAIDRVGKSMPPELLCTSKGGCCDTPSGRACMARFWEWSGAGHEDRPNIPGAYK